MIRTTAATALIAALIAVTGSAQASTSGTIRLKGSVAANCTVTVTDNSVALNLAAGENNRTVGQVVETCNSGTGYTISISSANAGRLTSNTHGTTPISYTVGYDGANGGLTAPLAVTRDKAEFGRTSNLTVTVPASNQYIAGQYNDVVTISIAAK